MMADYRLGGDLPRLKALLANDIPVVVEMWFTPHPNDGMGHYRLLVGYDDIAGRFIAYDSYDPPGINVPLPYGPFDTDWRVFNRTYVPVYPPEKAPVVDTILGTDRDDQAMLQHALDVATSEATAQPNDAYAWFNVGSTLTAMGRSAEAVPAFDRARALKLPWRMLWYQFAPFQAYLDAGRYNDVLSLTGANLQQASDLEESQYYRGRALQAQGQTAQARTAYQAALKANPKYTPAYYSLSTLS
jgi:tetratricopeptide (TPR) repeat protein